MYNIVLIFIQSCPYLNRGFYNQLNIFWGLRSKKNEKPNENALIFLITELARGKLMHEPIFFALLFCGQRKNLIKFMQGS